MGDTAILQHEGLEGLSIIHFQQIIAENYDTRWTFPLHKHDFPELSLVTDGEGTLEYDHVEYPMRKGMLVIKAPGIVHSEITSENFPIHQLCVGIGGTSPIEQQLRHQITDSSPILDTMESFPYLEQTLRFLYTLYQGERKGSESTIAKMLEALFSAVILLINSQPEAQRRERRQYSELIQNILNYIEQHYREDIPVETIAERFYVSTSTLSHRFREEVGHTVKQYVLDLRLGEAERQLVFEDTGIREISEMCGYSNLQYFYNIFKKATGLTPVAFRGKYKEAMSY